MEAESKIKWYKVADDINALNWNGNNMTIAEAGSKTITLVRQGNDVVACAHKCPHASGIIAEGFIDARGNVVCPVHKYRFSLQNGRNTSGEGYRLKIYPLEKRGAGCSLVLKKMHCPKFFDKVLGKIFC